MVAIFVYAIFFAVSFCGYLYIKKYSITWKYKKYLPLIAGISLICMLVGIYDFFGQRKQELSYIERSQVGEGARQEQLVLDAGDVLSQYTYSVKIEEQRLTETEIQLLFEKGKQELEQVILGENKSAEEVCSSLAIPTTLGDGKVEVSCYFDPYELVDTDGTILWENCSEEMEILKVSAQMYCQDMEATHEFYLRLVPPPSSVQEDLLKRINYNLQKENNSYGQEMLKLPQEINGVALEWSRDTKNNHPKVFVMGLLVLVLWYVAEKEKQEKEKKAWNQGLILDYPDIVSKLSLLSGAGMTITAAWEKIVMEYRKGKESGGMPVRPGYEEMLKTWHEMKDGVGDMKAYENFGKRCNQSTYRKFASLLMQNVRKGTKGMQQLLDAEAVEAFQLRKAYAKQMGEEAGTKLLIPMGLMLLLVFAVLMLPAMLSLNL